MRIQHKIWFLLITLNILTYARLALGHNYGLGFFNKSGCLYAHIGGGVIQLSLPKGPYYQELYKDNLTYIASKSKCIKNYEPGKLAFSFDAEPPFKSINITMKIVSSPREHTWEVSQANLTLTTEEARRSFPLDIDDIIASEKYSYSCSGLTLKTRSRMRQINDTEEAGLRGTIILEEFQLQPFEELKTVVFAPSFDCSTWMTLPGLMGFALILFMIIITGIGVFLLLGIENNDYKFNKEGILFTQAQMEINKQK